MAEDPRSTYYTILDLTSPAGRRQLFAREASGDQLEVPGARVLEIALRGANSAVVEHLYVDRDYASAYSRFYSRVYRRVGKWCERIHFFTCDSESLDLSDLSKNQAEYLGFTVVRPLSTFKTGRTVLTPSGTAGEEFHLAIYDHQANVAGSTLKVRGAAFLQQERRTAACASAAIWMATEGYAPQLRLRGASSTEITDLATAYDVSAGRAMPSDGLTTGQMLQALRGLGLDPVLYQRPKMAEARNWIYSYVESQIPVIVGVQFETDSIWHSVTAIGHTYDPTRTPETQQIQLHDRSTLEYRQSSGFVGSFVVNDDQRGPYRKLRLLEASEYPANYDPWGYGLTLTPDNSAVFELDCAVNDLPDGLGAALHPVRGVIRYVMVPLAPGVSLRAEEAEIKAAHWIHGFPLLLGSDDAANALRQRLNLSELVLRTYLRPSNLFKEEMATRRGINNDLRAVYRAIPLPKYVWVTEVSSVPWMSRKSKSRRMMCGEILNDCSGNPFTASFVSIHLPGYFVRTGPEAGDPDLALVEGLRRVSPDNPYAHLSR